MDTAGIHTPLHIENTKLDKNLSIHQWVWWTQFCIGTMIAMIWWRNNLYGWLVVTRGCYISLFGAMVSRVDDVVILVILWVTDDNSCGHKRMQSSITSLEFVTYLRKIIVFYSKYQFRPAVANVSFFGEIYKVVLVWDYIFKLSVYFLSI